MTTTGFEPVSTRISKVLTFSVELLSRSVIVFRWSCTLKRFCRYPSGSASIMPDACWKQRSATSCVGPITSISARGRWFISMATRPSAPAPVVFEFFFGTMAKISATCRAPVTGSTEPKAARTISRNHSPAAVSNAGAPTTSGKRSLLKMATALLAWALSSGKSGTSERPAFRRSAQSGQANDHAAFIAAEATPTRCPHARTARPDRLRLFCRASPAWAA